MSKHDLVSDKERKRTNEQAKGAIFGKLEAEGVDEVHLMLRIVRAADNNVLERSFSIHTKALRDSSNAVRSERILGVDVGDLTSTTAVFNRKLSSDAQSVAKLRLAGAELAIDFGQALSGHAVAEHSIKAFGPSGDVHNALSADGDFGSSLEV